VLERRPWVKGEDGFFHPTPPYKLGEVVLCDAGHAVRVNERSERWQDLECRRCREDEDGYVMSLEGGA
jgi:hypothetical protein